MRPSSNATQHAVINKLLGYAFMLGGDLIRFIHDVDLIGSCSWGMHHMLSGNVRVLLSSIVQKQELWVT